MWGTQGRNDGQFYYPQSLAFAPNGNVYVADTDNHRVQYFTATGGYRGKWGSNGTGNGEFRSPTGIAVTGDGTVYVADYFNNRTQYFTLTGSFLGKFGTEGTANGQFKYPREIDFSPDGKRLYVMDENNDRVQYFKWVNVAVSPASLGKVKALFR
jgi:DNA-binding beta-propeller fold protein YncE